MHHFAGFRPDAGERVCHGKEKEALRQELNDGDGSPIRED